MTLEDILKLDIEGKNIAVVGLCASGKTYLANKLGNDTHTHIFTDNWIDYGYEQGMYQALEAINSAKEPVIAEGVYMYRILRKGSEIGNYAPHLIIECQRPRQKREQTYLKERDSNKIKYLQKFELGLLRIWTEYLMNCSKAARPEILVWENEF